MSLDNKSLLRVSELSLMYHSKIPAIERPHITDIDSAYQLFRQYWSNQIEIIEEFYAILLNRTGRVLGISNLSKGGMSGTVVDAKLLFATAILSKSSSVIIAHNHPSGAVFPSKQDIELTYRLVEGGKLLDIKIIDHLIISPYGEYYSFALEGNIIENEES